MGYGFLDIATTPNVRAAQAANGSADQWAGSRGERDFDRFTDAEAAFIDARDDFDMATVSETGWPYVQHRGGPPGLLQVPDERTPGFTDFRGNRQHMSLGNLQACDRVSLILVDHPARRRWKLFGNAEVRNLTADPASAERLAAPGYRGPAERAFLIRLAHFDWNCLQHIASRLTAAELDEALAHVRQRLAALAAENETLRAQLVRSRTIPRRTDHDHA